MSDSEENSDVEIPPAPKPKTIKKTEENTQKDPKKLTTKEMVHAALKELHTRNGVSLYAIKKYMVARFDVNTDKINFFIKKYIKKAVESGDIIQTKGIGVSGSFKLAPQKKAEKKVKKTKEKIEKDDKPKRPKTLKEKKEKATKDSVNNKTKLVKKGEKKSEEKTKKIKEKQSSSTKKKKTATKKVAVAENAKKEPKKKTVKSKMAPSTPAKKKNNMMKRKSIGSIIKPPKMKPKIRE